MDLKEYCEIITEATDKMRKWAKTQKTLPDDPWQLPADCPLWSISGISLAVAREVLSVVREEKERAKEA